MKNLLKIFLGILVFSPLTISCERLLDVDSNRLVLPDEHQMDSPNDTLYSMVGIFSQLEKLSDRYVLLGELRGDLMDITKYANPDIREIYNFEILPDNPYNQRRGRLSESGEAGTSIAPHRGCAGEGSRTDDDSHL